MVIDESSDHLLSLWEWQKGERGIKIAETRVGYANILVIKICPTNLKNPILFHPCIFFLLHLFSIVIIIKDLCFYKFMQGSSDLVVAVEWNPIPKERFAFVTCGKGHICFWTLDNGFLSRKLGIFESRDKPKYVTCIAFADNGDVRNHL